MEYLKRPIHIPEKKEALFALTLSAIILGANAPIAKWTLQYVSIETLAFFRFFIAFILFFLIFNPKMNLKKQDLPMMFLCGLVGISIHIPIFYLGISMTNAINAAIIAASIPILSLFFTRYLLNERISTKLVFGGIVGLLGVFLIILEPFFEKGLSPHFTGNLLLLLSAIAFIGFEIMSKKLVKRDYHSLTITTYSYLVGFASFLPFFAIDSIQNGLYFISLPVILGATFIILLSTVAAIPLWQWGISKLELSRAGFFLYLDPVSAFIVGFFLLGEVISMHMLVGAILIFLGLYIAENTLHLPHFHLYRVHFRKKVKE